MLFQVDSSEIANGVNILDYGRTFRQTEGHVQTNDKVRGKGT